MGIRNIFFINPTDSDLIKGTKIAGYFGLIGLLITGVIQLYPKDKSSSDTNYFGDFQSSMSGGGVANTYIINNVPESATKQAIIGLEELQKKVNQTDDKVELTRQQIELLSQALKDLDQRTSGIEKLPDGRTKFGTMLSGTPSILIQEHNLAISYFNSGNYTVALIHSENAIKAYEDSQKIKSQIIMIIGDSSLNPEDVSKLYYIGALAAQRLNQNDLANQYAKKALDANPSPINNAVYATTLYNLGMYNEALAFIEKAVQVEPTNSEFLDWKKKISLRIGQ